MNRHLVTTLAGLLFGAGLVLSGMADPARVLGFLRLGSGWDPTLAWVMAGALLVTAPGFAWLRHSGRAPGSAGPAPGRIDRRLLLGAALFGLGWGLAGYCPGPSLVAAGQLQPGAALFVLAMLCGMVLATRLWPRAGGP
jgi:uncharacterized protein